MSLAARPARIARRRLGGVAAMWIAVRATAGVAALLPPGIPADVEPLPVADVLALTPEMKAWVHREVPASLPDRQRLDLLVRRLQADDGAGLRYDAWYTAGAAEAFAARRFNCLAFSHLVVAMARELGLPAYYLEQRGGRYGREGDLVLLAGHVTVGWGRGPQRWAVEFGANGHFDPMRARLIDDRRALALHYVNLGAGSLRHGDLAAALAALATALQSDPHAGAAWVNLGVALRRRGDASGAEAAYRRAIEVEPEVLPAWANLFGLLRASGRSEAAAALLTEVARRPHRDPWLLLAMGDECLNARDLAGAGRLYKQARAVAPDEPSAPAALASWAVASGDQRAARRWLQRAEALDPREPRLVPVRAALGISPPPPGPPAIPAASPPVAPSLTGGAAPRPSDRGV